MLESMTDFFAARLEGYDEHMRRDIEGASDFYAYTAALLPADPGASVLDLGCGTGLELEKLFALNPSARVTGIDLSAEMLDALKWAGYNLGVATAKPEPLSRKRWNAPSPRATPRPIWRA